VKISIQSKLIIIFSAIIIVVFIALNVIIAQILRSNSEQIIYSDLSAFKTSCTAYIEQVLDLNDFAVTPGNFNSQSSEIGKDINLIMGKDVSLFKLDGTPLFHTTYELVNVDTSDLMNALAGNEAYTIVQNNGKVNVYYSFPVAINGVNLGVIRMYSDYTSIFSNSKLVSTFVLYTSIVMLTISFVLLLVFLNNTIKPIKKLTRAIQGVKGDLNKAQGIAIDRHDEIGKLALEYNDMLLVIKTQIATIQRERDMLKKLLEYRKVFFDNVTHELKTPLTIILGYAELLKENGVKDRELTEKGLNHIVEESERLRNMVIDILKLSKDTVKIEDEFEAVYVLDIINRIVESMNIKAKRYGSYIKVDGDSEISVMGSAEKLRQLFINLIDNAIKYGQPGKPIEVFVESAGDKAEVVIKNYTNNIDKNEFNKIFEPFYTSTANEDSRETGSVGLGLAICKNIAVLHGGTVTVDMETDVIQFKVSLPLNKTEGVK